MEWFGSKKIKTEKVIAQLEELIEDAVGCCSCTHGGSREGDSNGDYNERKGKGYLINISELLGSEEIGRAHV